MIRFLARLFIRDADNIKDPAVRRAYGVLCGGMGVALNLLLFAGKLLAGLLSGSISVVADAFNNLSDAGSSVVTLLGFKLAAHAPDRDHPFGHGRLEYISGLVVAVLILLMGAELGRSSLERLLHPEAVELRPLTAVILTVSILVKLYMAAYNRSLGRRLDSPAMSAAALDSLSDSLATAVVLLGALAGQLWDVALDGWCGLVVSAFILWSGLQAAKDTINPLLGQPPSPEFVRQVRELVLSRPEILGVHDLIVHDYGPGRRIISLHAEVPAEGSFVALHEAVDAAERELSHTMGCHATIHMDPVVSDGGLTERTRKEVAALADEIYPGLTIHDFRLVPGKDRTKVIFEASIPYGCVLSDQEVKRRLQAAVERLDSTYAAVAEVERGYL